MTQHSHQTAPTQFVDAAGVRFAYRHFGKSGGVPLVFNIHFIGTMDHWDPAVTDGLARDREVILFNNAGVSSSSGEVPNSGGGRPDCGSHYVTETKNTSRRDSTARRHHVHPVTRRARPRGESTRAPSPRIRRPVG
jgi:hypothetical protein